jgi:hypothetical protein
MNEPNLQAQQPVMTAQIQIKRAATGKVEDWTLTFTPLPEQQPESKPEDKQCP